MNCQARCCSLLLCLLLVLPSCRRGQQATSTATNDSAPVQEGAISAEAIAWNNNAVGLMGRYQYGEARRVFSQLADKYPDALDIKVNLAIACLNEDQGGARALPLLQEVLAENSDHLRANYCLGVLLREQGRLDSALQHFMRVHELDDQDAYVAYLIGECVEKQFEAEAIEWYESAVRIDPYFRTPHYRLFDLKRLAGDVEAAQVHLQKYQQLADSLLSVSFKVNYAQMGPKATCVVIGSTEDPAVAAEGPIFQEAQPLLAADFDFDSRDPARPISITACDLNADQRVDLFVVRITQVGTDSRNAVFRQREDGSFELAAEHPLAKVSDVNAAVWGDFDNDRLTDVYLCRTGANQLWRQTEPGRWQDVTQATNTAAGRSDTIDAAACDADHDGDLDLFVVNADGANELLNNNRDGTFRPLADSAGLDGSRPSRAVVPLDLDVDRDLDLIVINAAPPHEVYINDLAWQYRRVEWLADFVQADVSTALAADLDLDGRAEIYGFVGSSLVCWSADEEGSWARTTLLEQAVSAERAPQLAVADTNGDGNLELVVGADTWRVCASPNWSQPLYAAESVPLAGWTSAILDLQGPSVVGVDRSGRPQVWRPGSGRYPYVGLTLLGSTSGGSRARSNASGLGARAELRVGTRWSVVDQLRNHAGPGQSLQPLALGLGRDTAADFLRVHWPDGVTQVLLSVLPGPHKVVEEDQLPTSCPVLFVWNGERFEFVSDLLSVGGLGYFVAPGQYATPDPSESFLVPADLMVAREGTYQFKLAEPMEELTYLDHIQLTCYDLPAGWQMTLDERMSTGEPRPTGQPVFYRQLTLPARAWNDRGLNVLPDLLEVDQRAVPPGELDRRFVGRLAREHVLSLQFDEPIDRDDAHPVLLAEGWVEFPYSQTLFAGWQAGVSFDAPTLEYRDRDGRWQILLTKFGYPAGMPRQMSVPLAGLPAGVTTMRLRTNLEIYWDRIAVVYAEPCPAAQPQSLAMQRAELVESGITPRIILDQQRPHFDYERQLPYSLTRDPTGFYTAFGDVRELVAEDDNALAILGPAEEIQFEFTIPSKKLPADWTRRLVLSVRGWCKDMDLYTGQGQTVDPLPTAGELDQRRATLHRLYNRRFQHGRTE